MEAGGRQPMITCYMIVCAHIGPRKMVCIHLSHLPSPLPPPPSPLPPPPIYHKEFSNPHKVKQSPLLVTVAMTTSPTIFVQEQCHSGYYQQHNEILDERIGPVSHENTKDHHWNRFSGLCKNLGYEEEVLIYILELSNFSISI